MMIRIFDNLGEIFHSVCECNHEYDDSGTESLMMYNDDDENTLMTSIGAIFHPVCPIVTPTAGPLFLQLTSRLQTSE